MARFDGGWFKVYRRIVTGDCQTNPFYGDPALFTVWVHLIGWANIKPTKTRFGGKEIIVERGQILTSRGEISEKLGLSIQTVRRALTSLEATHNINRLANRNGMIITILNYDKYQSNEDNIQPTNQPISQPNNNRITTEYQPHSEEGKKERRKEEKDIRATSEPDGRPPMDPNFLTSPKELAELWNQLVADKLPRVQDFDSKQRRYVWARERIKAKPDRGFWAGVIKRVLASDFCRGQNERAWVADFEFLVRKDTCQKVLEGKYDNRVKSQPAKGLKPSQAEIEATNKRLTKERDERLRRLGLL